VEEHAEEFAALDALNVGQPFNLLKAFFLPVAVSQLRFYGGLSGKITGETVESNEQKFTYTRREPYGVVGQIVPWNGSIVRFPLSIPS